MDSSPVPSTKHDTDAPKRFECHDGPDVTVVVGGVEFEEYSHSLRLWSGYFDAAFRSGMKESETKRFEFPDKNPREWEFIRQLFLPFPKKKIDKANYFILYAWFSELCSSSGLLECDEVMDEVIDDAVKKGRPDLLVTALEHCIQWQRYKIKMRCAAELHFVLSMLVLPVVGFDAKLILRLLSVLLKDKPCQQSLWRPLKLYLPPCAASEGDFDSSKVKPLMDNEYTVQLVQLKVDMVTVACEDERLPPALQDLLSVREHRRAVSFYEEEDDDDGDVFGDY